VAEQSLLSAFMLVSCSAYFCTLKMEVIFSSETSADIQRTTRSYIPEDYNLHNHRCENLKSYVYIIVIITVCFRSFPYPIGIVSILRASL
jgi:hypothetical protein